MASSFRAWRARLNAPRMSGLALARGQLVVAGFALGAVFVPSSWSWLAPLPLALLFAYVSHAKEREAFVGALLFGAAFFAVHLAWLPESFARLFGPLGAVIFAPLVALLALLWGGTAAFTRFAFGRGLGTLWALPLAWTLVEWARTLSLFGFPWGTLGYALGPTPLAQLADLGGVSGLSLLVGFAASALASVRERPTLAAGVVLAWLAALAYGVWRERAPAPRADLRVLLVQGNVDPLEKAAGRAPNGLTLYENLTREALAGRKADLVVWPETAISPATATEDVRARFRALGAPLVLGAPFLDGDSTYNSALGVTGETFARRDKQRLVPFGETFPARDALAFAYEPLFRALGLPNLRGLTPGATSSPLALGAVRAAVAICYESTFPALTRNLVREGANLLVTISNDAWFGRTVGAEQHFQMGRLRAIETRRFLVRVGNDGVTAVVAPNGRVTQRFARGVRGAFRANADTSDATTLFVRLGDWPVVLATAWLSFSLFRRIYGFRRV